MGSCPAGNVTGPPGPVPRRHVLAGALVLASGAPASARIVERFSFEDVVQFVDPDLCEAGISVDYTARITGSGALHERGRDGLLFFHQKTNVVESFTHAGRTVTNIGHVLEKDLKVVDNGDGTLSVTVLLTGPQRTVNQEGKVIAKNDGQIRQLLVIDAASGDELSRELIFGSTGTNDDFCAAVLDDFGL